MAGNVVLVVDSDGSSTALLTEIVGEKAYDIVSVEDGDAALAHLKKQLPVAMLIHADAPEGLKTCQIVKEKEAFSSVPLVLVSDPDAAELDLATLPEDAQPDHHLLRPIEEDSLRDALEGYLPGEPEEKPASASPPPPPVPTAVKDGSMEERLAQLTESLDILARNHRLLVDENSRLFRQRQQALALLTDREKEEGKSDTTADTMKEALADADVLAEKLRAVEELLQQKESSADDNATDSAALEAAESTAKEAQEKADALTKELEELKKTETKLSKTLEERDQQLKDAHTETASLVQKLATQEEADSGPSDDAERLRKELKKAMGLIQQCAIDLAQGRNQLEQAANQDEYRKASIQQIGKTWQELSSIARGIGKEPGLHTYSAHLEEVLASLKENLRSIRTLLEQSSKSRTSQEQLVDKMYKTLTSDWST